MLWYPKFGCALLVLAGKGVEEDVRPLQGHARLLLVGLDRWEFQLHGTR